MLKQTERKIKWFDMLIYFRQRRITILSQTKISKKILENLSFTKQKFSLRVQVHLAGNQSSFYKLFLY